MACTDMLRLSSGRVLVADSGNNRILMLSADLKAVSTVVAGDGAKGHRNGAAAQAKFNSPDGLALLPDGRVLVADTDNRRIRMLSADLEKVSTVAGDGTIAGVAGYRDGAALRRRGDRRVVQQARFTYPRGLALLSDGRVLVADDDGDETSQIRVLSADLQEVSTLTIDGVVNASAFELLPDGRVLMAAEGGLFLCTLTNDDDEDEDESKQEQLSRSYAARNSLSAENGESREGPQLGGSDDYDALSESGDSEGYATAEDDEYRSTAPPVLRLKL